MARLFSLSLSIALAVFVIAVVLFEISRLPKIAEVRDQYRSQDKVILDRREQIIDEVRVEKQVRRLAWTPVDQLPMSFVNAVIRAEDSRFFYHPGLDPFNKTLTVRVAQMIGSRFPQVTAIALEMKWNKQEILETFLNLVNFRGELQGIAAASHGLFDKPPQDLTRAEGAVLASLIRAPYAQVSSVRAQACRLLKKLGTPEECGALSLRHLSSIEKGYYLRPYVRMAPHVARRLSDYPELRGRNLVRSTLDREIQWNALHALQTHGEDGAVVVLENNTGNILAYVGNIGSASKNAYVDEALVLRPAGSVLKPLIFAKALDERILTTASRLERSATGRETVTVKTALTEGLDIPALRVMELLGVENFVGSLAEWGFTGLKRADFYGPSLALGSADVRLFEVANAYRVLANGGMWSEARFSPDITSATAAKRVLGADTVFVVGEILAHSAKGLWSAVNSGPNWCVGYSDKFTVAVTAGGETAAPVWREIMAFLHKQEPSQAPLPPVGLKQTGGEWYLPGTEPVAALAENAPSVSRFSFPQNRATVPVDLNRNPRMFIQITAPKIDQNVYLDRRRIGRAKPMVPWEPQLGRHVLELRDSSGAVLDKISFDVRGREFVSAP